MCMFHRWHADPYWHMYTSGRAAVVVVHVSPQVIPFGRGLIRANVDGRDADSTYIPRILLASICDRLYPKKLNWSNR